MWAELGEKLQYDLFLKPTAFFAFNFVCFYCLHDDQYLYTCGGFATTVLQNPNSNLKSVMVIQKKEGDKETCCHILTLIFWSEWAEGWFSLVAEDLGFQKNWSQKKSLEL